MPTLQNKNVLITDASLSLSQRLATRCAADGAHLILCCDDPRVLQEQIVHWKRTAASVSCVRVAMPDIGAVQAAMEVVLADVGYIDVVVNIPRLVASKGLLNTTVADMKEGLNANLLAASGVVRAVLPGMVARHKGHIVNVAPAAYAAAQKGALGYLASRSAALDMHRALRAEMQQGGHNIDTTVVCSGAWGVGLMGAPMPEQMSYALYKALCKPKAQVSRPFRLAGAIKAGVRFVKRGLESVAMAQIRWRLKPRWAEHFAWRPNGR